MGIDVAAVRADTPAVQELVHLDNAGSALVPARVHEAVVEHLRLEERIGGYRAQDRVADRLEGVRGGLARLVGASPEEIALTESATRAWELALGSVPLRAGERVLTTTSEYSSNGMGLLKATRAVGAHVRVVPDDAAGQMDLAVLERELAAGGVRLVAVNHMPTHNGLVNPVERIGALCRAHGVLFLVDACQSVGQAEVDVGRLGCDVLTATGRKYLRAPRGTGFLYVRSGAELAEPPTVDVSSAQWQGPDRYRVRRDARRYESFESSVACRLGLGVAVEYALALGMKEIQERVRFLGEHARERLRRVPGVRVWDRGEHRSGIVTFSVAGREAGQVCERLWEQGVNVSVSRVSNQVWEGSTRVPERVRASVHYYNTEEEVEFLARALE